ncbi:hypothetical protein [Streptomyces sp. NRRL S-448]|uniref:hypothetical protein n=1 Tax=Streptomyces sp. NRRL S-448 TaxID=1463907 RepID=UPI003561A6D1
MASRSLNFGGKPNSVHQIGSINQPECSSVAFHWIDCRRSFVEDATGNPIHERGVVKGHPSCADVTVGLARAVSAGVQEGWGRENMNFPRARAASLAVSLGAALALGLLGAVSEKWDNPAGVAANAVFSGGWSWACYAFLVGYFRRSKIESALLPSFGLAVGVATYYLLKDFSHAAPNGWEAGASGEGSISKILVWGTLAFVFGAPVGFFGNLARVPGVGGLFFRLLIPLVAFYETSMRLAVEARGAGSAVIITWNAVRLIAVAVAFVLVGHVVRSWWNARRTRPIEV